MSKKELSSITTFNMVNGCYVLTHPSEEIQDFPFCSDVIFLDEENQVGIEFNDNVRIRIDGISTTALNSFIKMMDALVILANEMDYHEIFFADELPDEVLNMFLFYGFSETIVLGDNRNHYLYFRINDEDM